MPTIPMTGQVLYVIAAVQDVKRFSITEAGLHDAIPAYPKPEDWMTVAQRYFNALPLDGTGLVKSTACFRAVDRFEITAEMDACVMEELPRRFSFQF